MWTDDFIACLEKSTTAQPSVQEALAIKDRHLPKRIYKYRRVCPNHISNFRSDTVRLSSPESFNDPYDCWLTLADDMVATLIERRVLDAFVKANKLQNVIPQTQIDNARKSVEPLKTIVQFVPESTNSAARSKLRRKAEFYSSKARDIANNKVVSILHEWRKMVKLCSFSAANDSLLMWGHYSDNHTGFCLEYDIEELNADHPFRKNLYPVIYSNQLYYLRLWAEKLVALNHPQLTDMLPLLSMIHKFEGWKYEEEWRMIFEYGVATDDHNQPAPKPSRIFLGSKMNNKKSQELLAVCEQKKIAVDQMRLADDRFELLPEPFKGGGKEVRVEKVNGIGGLFFRARDPVALGQWYLDHIGVPLTPSNYKELPWQQEAGPTAFSPFPEITDYFGDPNKTWMVNFRVSDLDAMVAQLRNAGTSVEVDEQHYPNGRFARLKDPDGNPIQLWEPKG